LLMATSSVSILYRLAPDIVEMDTPEAFKARIVSL
jgi:hypothetical protein